MKLRTFAMGVVATVVVALGGTLAAGPATAAPTDTAALADSAPATDSSLISELGITEEQWHEEADRLIASDLPRTVTEVVGGTEYVFHLDIDEEVVPGGGTFDLAFVVDAEGDPDLIQPMLGAGSDSRGAYILLNNYDQNMLIGGYTTAIAVALCAIPAIGWVSCAVITAATVAAASWLAVNNTCPQNLKVYLFQASNAYVCVPY